ncbi:MAG: putative membrane protein [Parvicella sp.]|jgi:uncharacterized membrane protein
MKDWKLLVKEVKFMNPLIMLNFKQFSLFISLLILCSLNGTGQTTQEKYLRKSQDSKSFDKTQWKQLKKTVTPESGGSADNFGDSKSSSEWSDANFDMDDSEMSEGDNYGYEYEDYNDEYSDNDPNDPYDNTDYQRNGSYQKDRNLKGYDHYQKKRRSSDRPKRIRKPKKKSVSMGGAGISFLQVLMWAVIILAVSFLLYYFFVNGNLNEKGAKIESNFEDMSPSEIPKTELERRLEVALSENNFREAIRIYFIFTIKDLSSKKWINWEKEKTNISYLYEMRGRTQYQQFNEAVNIFDQVWYGEIEITKEQYQSIEPKYTSLLKSINS